MFELYEPKHLSGHGDVKMFPIVANVANGAALRVSANYTTAAVSSDGSNFIGYTYGPQPWSSDTGYSNAYQAPGVPPGTNGTVAAGTFAWIGGHRHVAGDWYKVPYAVDAANDIDALDAGSDVNNIGCAGVDATPQLIGGWLYIISGPGAGQCRYISANVANTSIGVASPFVTVPTAASRFIVLRPVFSEDTRLITAGTHVLGQAAQTATTAFRVLAHLIQFPGQSGQQLLTPTGSGSLRERGTLFLGYNFAAATATTVAEPPIFYAVLEPIDPF